MKLTRERPKCWSQNGSMRVLELRGLLNLLLGQRSQEIRDRLVYSVRKLLEDP